MWEAVSENTFSLFDVFDLACMLIWLSRIFQALIFTRFVLRFQYTDLDLTAGKLKLLSGAALYVILLTLADPVIPFFGGTEAVSVVFFFLLSLPFTAAKLYLKAFSSLLCVFAGAISQKAAETFSLLIFNRPSELLFAENILAEPAVFASVQLINLAVFELILRFSRDRANLEKKEWLFLLWILIISFAAVILSEYIPKGKEKGFDSLLSFGVTLCFCAVIIICFNMTVKLNREKEEREKTKLSDQQNEFRKHYAENAVKQYDEIKRIRHDMKHSYGVIQTLLGEGKTEEIFSFIQKNAELIAGVEIFMDLGNDTVNSLLNSKLSDAKRRGIDIICNADISLAGIDEADICGLLGNMIDNAVEACEKCAEGKRVMEITMKSFEEKYLFEVSNSVSGNVFEENLALNTTKEEKELHGFGVKSIRSVAEKYGGSACFVQEGNMFRCDAVLMR